MKGEDTRHGRLWGIVGFALYRAWGYLTFFSSSLLAHDDAISLLNIGYIVSLLVLGAALASATRFAERLQRAVASSRVLQMVGPFCAAGGTALLACMDGSSHMALACMVAGGVATGLGTALLVLGWCIRFGTRNAQDSGYELIASFVIAACVFLALLFAPHAAYVALTVACPLVSGLIASAKLGTWGITTLHEPAPVDRALFARKFGVGVALVCIAIGFGQSLYLARIDLVYGGSPFSFVASSLVAAAFVFAMMKFPKNFDFGLVYRASVLLAIFGFLVLPLLDGRATLSVFVVTTGYLCFQLVLYILLADICFRLHYSPIVVFGFGEGTLAGSIALGSLINRLLTGSGPLTAWQSDCVSVLTVAILIVTYTFVLKERDIWRIVADRSKRPYNNGPLKERCGEIAERYGLGNRESEVLFLFAKGRSAKRIQEELFISAGTVNTHMSRIYKKIGVHTRQELLDVIEAGAKDR